MKQLSTLLLLVPILLLPCEATELKTGSPEAAGVSSLAILEFIDAVERDVNDLHSFVLVRHGKVISEGWWAPYEKESPHMLYSLSKSFTSTAIGMAIDEGLLSLDDKVISFFPNRVPGDASQNLTDMRIRDLLCMGTGNHNDTLRPMQNGTAPDWIKVFLKQPVEHEPGTHFRYNTGATYMLSAILQDVTGKRLLEYLTPRLFDPLGIENPTWETSAQGIDTGGYGLKVKTRDIAKLGQLYLQKGRWNGKRLLSEAWVAAASSKQISNGDNPNSDWKQGYGFQFWLCRHNAYRGDGAFGQYCVVMPDQDAVLAITSGLGNMQQVLNIAWKHLLPAMKNEALVPAQEDKTSLDEKVRSLQLQTVKGDVASPADAGVLGKVYQFKEDDKGLKSASLHQEKTNTFIMISNAHGEQRIDCGFGQWKRGELIFEKSLLKPVGVTNENQSVAASGAWTAPGRYVADLYLNETPFRLRMTLQFKDDNLFLNLEYNVAFGRKTWKLTGKR